MRSFNSNNMADENYNTSQTNLQQQQQQHEDGQQQRHQQVQELEGAGRSGNMMRSDSLQELNEELMNSSGNRQQQQQQQAHQQQAFVRSGSSRIGDEMSQDLQFLSREAPLDGGESTFGLYSTLGGTHSNQPNEQVTHTTTSSHQQTYTTTTIAATPPNQFDDNERNSAIRRQLENDYERTNFRIDADEDQMGSSGHGEEDQMMRQMRASTAAAIVQQQSKEALEQLAPDNVDIQRPLQQAG